MFSTLFVFRRVIASSIVVAALAHCVGTAALAGAPDQSIEFSSLQGEKLAHHGGEGAESGAAMGALGGASLMGVNANRDAIQDKKTFTDSLWGNMLLSMAYQQDEDLQTMLRRLGHISKGTMLAVGGIAGLGLAQSVYSYRHLEPKTYDVTGAHHPGGHDHVHMEAESKVPSTMGIISSGVTLATLGGQALASSYYTRKIKGRQLVIRGQVDDILAKLEEGASPESVWPELNRLVGQRASREFLQLWLVVRAVSVPVAAASAGNTP